MGLSRVEYLSYIAYFSKTGGYDPSVKEVDIFKKFLGAAMLKAPDAKVQDLARHLYMAHTISLYTKYTAKYLALALTSKQLIEYMKQLSELNTKYGLYKSVDDDLSIKNIDAQISKSQITGYVTILNELIHGPAKPAKKATTKAAAKAAPKKVAPKVTKTPAKTKAAPKVTKTPVKAPVKAPAKAKQASKVTKAPAKAKTPAKKQVKKTPVRTVPELRKMAAAKGIVGYSKMTKPQLLKVLKIKA